MPVRDLAGVIGRTTTEITQFVRMITYLHIIVLVICKILGGNEESFSDVGVAGVSSLKKENKTNAFV